jgi:uncharacterized protein (DUF3084 family)
MISLIPVLHMYTDIIGVCLIDSYSTQEFLVGEQKLRESLEQVSKASEANVAMRSELDLVKGQLTEARNQIIEVKDSNEKALKNTRKVTAELALLRESTKEWKVNLDERTTTLAHVQAVSTSLY